MVCRGTVESGDGYTVRKRERDPTAMRPSFAAKKPLPSPPANLYQGNSRRGLGFGIRRTPHLHHLMSQKNSSRFRIRNSGEGRKQKPLRSFGSGGVRKRTVSERPQAIPPPRVRTHDCPPAHGSTFAQSFCRKIVCVRSISCSIRSLAAGLIAGEARDMRRAPSNVNTPRNKFSK